MKTLINTVVTSLEENLAKHSSSYKHQVLELHHIDFERHILFEHMVTSSKESIILKVQDLIDLFKKEFKKLTIFCDGVKKYVDVLMGGTWTLVEEFVHSTKNMLMD